MTADEILLNKWIFGYQISQAISVAAKLEIADFLEMKPQHYEQLSVIAKCHPEALRRLLKALATIGIFKETDTGIFSQTTLSRLLVKHHEKTLYTAALMYGDEQYRAWGELLSCIKTGEESFSSLYQEKFFPYLETHPESLKVFNQYMNQHAPARIEAILNAYDFSKVKKIVDIGGGHGYLLINLLRRHPTIRGVVFDTEKVIRILPDNPDIQKLNGRVEFTTGDFFESVPIGADTYFLSQIIHGWDDQHANKILKNCYHSMNKDGRLLLVERIITAGNEPDYGKWMDLTMLVMLNGKERTQEEYRELLRNANFDMVNVISTHAGLSIIEAVPHHTV